MRAVQRRKNDRECDYSYVHNSYIFFLAYTLQPNESTGMKVGCRFYCWVTKALLSLLLCLPCSSRNCGTVVLVFCCACMCCEFNI
ncbi:hypothetical protein ES319_D12G222700v1 [Gossypium barbadense]|uniref:Uncharacterized protein n=2 Tax=Gossypium TaxID=3633 RepID=A0A5J5P3Q8_GOSBA|nr:hypothetical protein ES319_D12G222700v1 [Gossypium barbadense]TYG42172.1 hypothetical protein ES288_D12G236400v1 [Gossypium darwinii]